MCNRVRLGVSVAAAILAMSAVAAPSFAADPFAGVAPVSTDTLKSERAGFFTVGGLELGFTANVQTTVNGVLALTSTLTLQDNGSVASQTTVNPNLGGNVVTVNGGAQLSAVTGLN